MNHATRLSMVEEELALEKAKVAQLQKVLDKYICEFMRFKDAHGRANLPTSNNNGNNGGNNNGNNGGNNGVNNGVNSGGNNGDNNSSANNDNAKQDTSTNKDAEFLSNTVMELVLPNQPKHEAQDTSEPDNKAENTRAMSKPNEPNEPIITSVNKTEPCGTGDIKGTPAEPAIPSADELSSHAASHRSAVTREPARTVAQIVEDLDSRFDYSHRLRERAASKAHDHNVEANASPGNKSTVSSDDLVCLPGWELNCNRSHAHEPHDNTSTGDPSLHETATDQNIAAEFENQQTTNSPEERLADAENLLSETLVTLHDTQEELHRASVERDKIKDHLGMTQFQLQAMEEKWVETMKQCKAMKLRFKQLEEKYPVLRGETFV